MAKIGVVIILLLFSVTSYSQQQGYLILIDADNAQPFHVQIGDSTFRSSGIGHLTIPYLKDSIYKISIGFPKNRFREQAFSIAINKKDQGFQIKNLEEGNWSLYNWQTREIKAPLPEDTGRNLSVLERGVRRDDAFSRLMASVVNDTSVMYSAFEASKPKTDTVRSGLPTKPDSALAAGKKNKDTVLVSASLASAKPAKEQAINHARSYPFIRKLSQRSLRSSLRIIFIDAVQPGSLDTVTLFIPFERDLAARIKQPPKVDSLKNKSGTAKELRHKVDSTRADTIAGKTAVLKTDCKDLAAQYDMDVIRVNILVENTETAKIEAAKKIFKTKCFSVRQIRILTDLFANDPARYHFFEAAYPYVSDRNNFGQLVKLLTDGAYIKQFKGNFQ